MSLSFETLAAANKFTKDTAAGAGAVAGKPCQIQSITEITGGHRVTFLWIDNNNTSHTSTMDVMDGAKGDKGDKGDTGIGIKSMAINASKHVIVTYDNNTTEDIGEVPQVQADWSEESSSADSFIKNKPTLGTAAAKDYTPNVAPNNHNLVESNAVYNAINTAVSSVYTPRGELSCAELTSALLIAANVGSVYEMSDSGTTSDLFLQGAGKTITAGNNVGIIQVGVDVYKFNLMGNAFDLHNYQTKVEDATSGNFAALDAEGQTIDSGKKAADFATAQGLSDEAVTRSRLGAKNLLKNMAQTNTSWHDVSLRVNPDGTITLDGTSSAWDFKTLNYVEGKKMIPTGTYILSGACENTTLKVYADNVAICQKDGPGEATFTITDEMTETYVRMEMWSGKTYSNAVMYPMIRLATDADDTYQPYAPTNAQCLDMDDNAALGATNVMKYPYRETSRISGGIDVTDNGDGTVTFTEGTVLSTSPCTFWFERYASGMDAKPYRGKRMKFILDMSQALSYEKTNARIEFSIADSNDSGIAGTSFHVPMNQLRNEVIFTVPDNADHFTAMLWIARGSALPTFTIKPMITMAEYGGDYVPYAMTNRALTQREENVETFSDTIATYGGTITGLKRNGNVEITISNLGSTQNISADQSSQVVIYTLPEKFRPYNGQIIVGRAGYGTDYNPPANLVEFFIQTNGEIGVWNGLAVKSGALYAHYLGKY